MRTWVPRVAAAHSWSWSTKVSCLAVASATLFVALWLYMDIPLFLLPAFFGGVAIIIFTLRNPVYGVLAVVAAQYLPWAVGGITIFQLLGVLVSVLCLVSYSLIRKGVVLDSIAVPIVLFVLHTLYSLSFTHDPVLTLYFVRKQIFNALFCILLVNVIDSFRKLKWLLWAMAGMALLNSFVAGVEYATGRTVESRARGLQENENQLGEIAALGLMVALFAFLSGDRRWKRMLALAVCGILSIGVITSISRGAVFSVLMGLGFVALRESRHRLRFIIFAVLVGLALPWLPRAFYNRFENVSTQLRGTIVLSQRSELTTRGYFNKAGMRIWRSHPVLGVGLGNFGFYFIQPGINPGKRGSSSKTPPHNLYVQALAETGTVGFVVLGGWIFLAFLNYVKAERRMGKERADRSYLRACESLTLVALILYFSSGNVVYTNFALVMTLSSLCRRCVEKEESATVPEESIPLLEPA
ncbi:MAG TPA: O-antigen ligase family protein [Candidatus Polarisedimenticolia bacterium]|nr:O-antigen ligase family protein [Candidatus Polarisedimenticolia bacterium]